MYLSVLYLLLIMSLKTVIFGLRLRLRLFQICHFAVINKRPIGLSADGLVFFLKFAVSGNHQIQWPRKRLWATSLPDFDLYQLILWPHWLRCCERYMSTAINTSLRFHLRLTKSAGQITTRNKRTKMAARNFEGLQETRTQTLYVIGQKFTSEWVTHLDILPPNN